MRVQVCNLNPNFYTVEFVIVFTCLCVSALRQVAAIIVRLCAHDEVQINSWVQVANQNPLETPFAEKVQTSYHKYRKSSTRFNKYEEEQAALFAPDGSYSIGSRFGCNNNGE